ncbi:MAG: ABC transporter ATP-binding protein [Acidimicrobiales bacterium]
MCALEDVSLTIASGESISVVGASGSGKSTLLNLIGMMDIPTSGSVLLDGVDVTQLTTTDRARGRRTVGFVFQQFNLIPGLGALENVAAPLLPYTKRRVARLMAMNALGEVGLSGRERSLPSQLSGGQQQRVAIARALVVNPGLLLADEPTGNLDSGTSDSILDVLDQIREHRSMTCLIVTHNVEVSKRCDRIVALRGGHLFRS